MYEAFDIDEDASQRQYESPIKTREKMFTDKFSKSITRNFMHESSAKQEQIHEKPLQPFNNIKNESARQKRKNNRLNSRILKPLSNPQKTDIPKIEEMKLNVALNIFNLQDEEIQQASSPMKLNPNPPQPLFNHENSEQINQFEQFSLEDHNVQMPNKKEANILFYEEDQSEMQHQNNIEEVQLPNHQIVPRFLQEVEMSSNLSALEEVVVHNHANYFHIQNKQRLQQEVLELVRPLHTLKMILTRDNSGFKTFWPEFFMKFPKDEHSVICAKRTTARPISTFIISSSQTDFEQTSSNYLGKIKSNALGDVLYVYGPGYNPSNAKEKKLRQRQMVATIRYQSNFFNANKPREFQVFTIRQGYKYFNLKGTKLYGDEPGLDELFNQEVNRDFINIYSNRKPVWNERAGGFMLNFKGRVPCASIKNFILDDPFGHEAMIFGRREKNQFTLQITDKISPFVAMAVALSAFDTRIMCE